MKVKILKTCQPKSERYEKGEELNLPADVAYHLMGAGLAKKVEKKYKKKVVEPETLKDESKDS